MALVDLPGRSRARQRRPVGRHYAPEPADRDRHLEIFDPGPPVRPPRWPNTGAAPRDAEPEGDGGELETGCGSVEDEWSERTEVDDVRAGMDDFVSLRLA
jgi:hypothetical protein